MTEDKLLEKYSKVAKYLDLDCLDTLNLFIGDFEDFEIEAKEDIYYKEFLAKLDISLYPTYYNILTHIENILEYKKEDNNLFNMQRVEDTTTGEDYIYDLPKEIVKKIENENKDWKDKINKGLETPKIINHHDEMIKISERYNFNTTDKFEILDKLVDMVKKSKNGDDIINNTLAIYAGVRSIKNVKNYKSEYFDLIPKFIYHLHRNYTY